MWDSNSLSCDRDYDRPFVTAAYSPNPDATFSNESTGLVLSGTTVTPTTITVPNTTGAICQRYCSMHANCRGFNFNNSTNACALYHGDTLVTGSGGTISAFVKTVAAAPPRIVARAHVGGRRLAGHGHTARLAAVLRHRTAPPGARELPSVAPPA